MRKPVCLMMSHRVPITAVQPDSQSAPHETTANRGPSRSNARALEKPSDSLIHETTWGC